MLKYMMSRFLLVFLSIETILQETTIYRRRERLRVMGNGVDLGGAYEATLGRIKAQGGEKARLGMAVLMWITHSRRPLRVEEICHAMAIRIGSNDLDTDDIPPISTLLGCCQGLVAMDQGVSTVRLIHFTLKEYLCTHPDLFDRAHSTMAETCLTYLNFQHVKDHSTRPSPDPRGTPFLEYCSLYWGTHMRMELSDRAKTFGLELLDQFDGHISAKSLWKSINGGLPFCCDPGDRPFSALHCISYFGIAEVADTLIKVNRWDVNQRDDAGMTPLILAARYGHLEVVRLLLRNKHIQPDQQDANFGRTALSWAAGNGHEGVVRLFLESEFVNPGSIGGRWGKARREVGLLFGRRYVNPDSLCRYGRTPLLWAAENGREGVVKLLLGRKDVNPRGSRRPGQTPLWLATGNAHEGIVKLLLKREDVNSNTPGAPLGQTPLSLAAEAGREGIVNLLLERRDVIPDAPDTEYGRTPLSWAAENGNEGAVRLLLWRKDVDPNSSDKSGRTPLSLAAEAGREGIVKLLLERRDVNPDTPDTRPGQTLLSWAAENGSEGVVKLLLERKDVNPDNSDKSGRTPLSLGVRRGHKGVVKLLLGREDINQDVPETEYGLTPLLWAIRNGHEGIVELLLERKDVNPNTTDTPYGQTPLSRAAEKGHEGIVKLLLGRADVDPDSLSQSGLTPLSWAARRGYKGVVKLLLEREDINPDIPDTEYGLTPLSWAIRNGHEGIVKLLLERADVNPINSSNSGQTPLTLAAQEGTLEWVQLP